MPGSRSLRRLLEVLRLQEEQARRAWAEAAAQKQSLRDARERAGARERSGRRLVAASAHSGALADRVAGLEEVRIAHRIDAMLAPRLQAAEEREASARDVFLARRTERRQVELLLEAAERTAAREEKRRAQRAADDLHLARSPRACETDTQ